MEVSELIESIYALSLEIRKFEEKYGVTSEDFYELFCQGKLDDGEYEQTEEFCMWAGIYETKIEREQGFQELSRKRIAMLERLSSEGEFHLMPLSHPAEVS